jgi:Flp pilus assembly protein TadD
VAEVGARFAPSDLTRELLGAAQYRTERYAAAVETLTKLVASQTDPKWNALAFLAMAHHRNGQPDQAGARMGELRALVDKHGTKWADVMVNKNIVVAEAAALIEGRAK